MANPDELVGAFIEAVPFAVRELAGVESIPREPRPTTDCDAFADVTRVVRLATAVGEGLLILSFPQGTAATMTSRVLAGVDDAPDEPMIRDCVGELANVIAGQAKVLLYGTPSHFMLSTPMDPPECAANRPGGMWMIGFDSDVGEFALYLQPPLAAAGNGADEASMAGSGG